MKILLYSTMLLLFFAASAHAAVPGYASPGFSLPHFIAFPQAGFAGINLTMNHSAVWGTVYYLDNYSWKPFELQGERIGNSGWITGPVTARVQIPLAELADEERLVLIAYGCDGSFAEGWRCSNANGAAAWEIGMARLGTGLAGIADLHETATEADAGVLARQHVDYSIMRLGWWYLEPSEGQYNFSYLQNELALARQHGKKTALRIFGGGSSPAWIKNDPEIPNVKYERRMQDGRLINVTVPVPWNEKYRQKYRQLIEQVAANFSSIDIVSVCGMDQACGLALGPYSSRNDWIAAGYSSDAYLETVKWYIGMYNQTFPGSILLFHTGKPFGDLPVLTGAIEYGKSTAGYRRFGLLVEHLKASFENPPGPGSLQEAMINYAQEGGWIGYQTVWSLTDDPQNANDCYPGEDINSCLLREVNAGMRDGSRYFELYEEDIRNLSVIPQIWNALHTP